MSVPLCLAFAALAACAASLPISVFALVATAAAALQLVALHTTQEVTIVAQPVVVAVFPLPAVRVFNAPDTPRTARRKRVAAVFESVADEDDDAQPAPTGRLSLAAMRAASVRPSMQRYELVQRAITTPTPRTGLTQVGNLRLALPRPSSVTGPSAAPVVVAPAPVLAVVAAPVCDTPRTSRRKRVNALFDILADEEQAVVTPRPSVKAMRAASKRPAIARFALQTISPQSSPDAKVASPVRRPRTQVGKLSLALPRPSAVSSLRL